MERKSSATPDRTIVRNDATEDEVHSARLREDFYTKLGRVVSTLQPLCDLMVHFGSSNIVGRADFHDVDLFVVASNGSALAEVESKIPALEADCPTLDIAVRERTELLEALRRGVERDLVLEILRTGSVLFSRSDIEGELREAIFTVDPKTAHTTTIDHFLPVLSTELQRVAARILRITAEKVTLLLVEDGKIPADTLWERIDQAATIGLVSAQFGAKYNKLRAFQRLPSPDFGDMVNILELARDIVAEFKEARDQA